MDQNKNLRGDYSHINDDYTVAQDWASYSGPPITSVILKNLMLPMAFRISAGSVNSSMLPPAGTLSRCRGWCPMMCFSIILPTGVFR